MKKALKKIWEWIGKLCMPRTQWRYTVSQSLALALSDKYGMEFKVIRNVPIRTFPAVKETRQKIIWYQGAINYGRGLECMMECMHELKDYSFYLAGDGDIISDLQQKIVESGLEARVHFLGRLSNLQLSEYSALAHVGIDLLESASKSYYLSLSNKTFDYIQAGLPAIQMNFPEYREIHRQYKVGVLIEKVAKENILNAIRQLEDSGFYENCILACKEASKIFNWEREEKELIELYEK